MSDDTAAHVARPHFVPRARNRSHYSAPYQRSVLSLAPRRYANGRPPRSSLHGRTPLRGLSSSCGMLLYGAQHVYAPLNCHAFQCRPDPSLFERRPVALIQPVSIVPGHITEWRRGGHPGRAWQELGHCIQVSHTAEIRLATIVNSSLGSLRRWRTQNSVGREYIHAVFSWPCQGGLQPNGGACIIPRTPCSRDW